MGAPGMNARREAIRRMGMGLLGGGVALGSMRHPTGEVLRVGSAAADANAYPSEVPYPVPSEPSPLQRARRDAAAPLRARISDIEGHGVGAPLSLWQRNNGTREYHDVWACKSTSMWFKQCTLMDRQKAEQRTLRGLYGEVQRLMRDPLDQLDRAAREGIEALLAEIVRG